VLFQRRFRPIIGLDITTSSIKLIELSRSGDSYRVESYAAEPTPPNSINEKAIVDAQIVGDAVRRAVKRAGARSRECAVAISGDAAITKVIQMPRNLREAELESQVEMQADQYIPFPMEEVSFDFEVVGPSEKDPALLDAAGGDSLENVEQRQSAAGWRPDRTHHRREAFRSRSLPPADTQMRTRHGRNIAVIDFGASSTTASVLRDLKVTYTHDFAFGGAQLTRRGHATYGLSMEEPAAPRRRAGCPPTTRPSAFRFHRRHVPAGEPSAVLPASSSGREQPELILICGGCANIPGVADVIASRVGIPAERGDPLGQMKISTRALAQGVKKDATALLTACGLALRSFD
jgi:type IV pilus assembly protein PilM